MDKNLKSSELSKAIETQERAGVYHDGCCECYYCVIHRAAKRAQEYQNTIQYCAGILKDFGMDEAAPLEALVRRIVKRVQEVEEQLKREMIWKEEDPRIFKEQLRVSDTAFNCLKECHKTLEQQSRADKELIEKLELQLALWNATFSKYLSFEANGVKRVSVLNIINDFNKCSLAHAQGYGKK